MYRNVSFVGGGRITRILLEGLKSHNVLPKKIKVFDPDTKTHQTLKSLAIPGLKIYEKKSGDISAELIFLAVHPPMVKEIMPEIQKNLNPQSILISLVPVVKISALQHLAGGFGRIVRMIPNAPSIIGEGYNPVCFAGSISSQEKTDLITLFNSWGQTPEVEEDKLEAYAVLTAMGPTYFWFQWLELQRLGEKFGLSIDELKTSLYEMIQGSSQLLFNSEYSADDVLDMIPVRPLLEEEDNVCNIINNRISTLYSKLTSRT